MDGSYWKAVFLGLAICALVVLFRSAPRIKDAFEQHEAASEARKEREAFIAQQKDKIPDIEFIFLPGEDFAIEPKLEEEPQADEKQAVREEIKDRLNKLNSTQLRMLDQMSFEECFSKGVKALAVGENDNAIKCFNDAIKVSEREDAKSYNNRSVALARLGDTRNALLDADTAISLDGSFAAAYYNRAHILQSQGETDDAKIDFEQAERLGLTDAKRGKLYYELGLEQLKLNDDAMASESFDAAIALDPTLREKINAAKNRARDEANK